MGGGEGKVNLDERRSTCEKELADKEKLINVTKM
jgi:hypothetical protein